jgi:GMP synthase-like glutamine amidotransferase
MKPIAIIRFSPTEGPGHLATFLDQAGLAWTLVRIDAGDALPAAGSFSGLAMMGGPMSVNDPLPWIPPLLALIRENAAAEVPMIGHCLGGQLIAQALGGSVTDNACMEMGWHAVEVVDSPLARDWFGDAGAFTPFQWHYQTFSIPPGATRVLRNDYCENQAYVLGPHIGFQCHIEMTAEMVREWCRDAAEELRDMAPTPSIQPVAAILMDLDRRIAALNAAAEGIYGRWLEGVARHKAGRAAGF